MNVGAVTASAEWDVRSELERLWRALSKEQNHAAGSLHFLSTNWEELEALHNALMLLESVRAETLKLLASLPTPTETLTVINTLASTLRAEMLTRWDLRQFRASEAVARILVLILDAEIGIGSAKQ